MLGNDGFILLGKYQPICRVPRTHEYEYDVRVDELVLPFLRRDDASIGHHTPLITLFTWSSSRATTLINDTRRAKHEINIVCRAELTSYHRTSPTAVQALGLSGIVHQPQAKSTSTRCMRPYFSAWKVSTASVLEIGFHKLCHFRLLIHKV